MKQRPAWQRTHTCGELTIQNDGTEVVLNGWIENHRDHGQLVFVDLRDRYGVTQVVAHIETDGMADGTVELLRRLGAEDVVSVRGRVRARDADKVNKNRSTGEIELGGSLMPVTTYVLQVDEAFKGEFETVKDMRLAEIRMIGKARPVTVGTARMLAGRARQRERGALPCA